MPTVPNKPDRRISAALSLAGELKEKGLHREATTIADLCHTASGQRTMQQKQHRDLMRYRELLKAAAARFREYEAHHRARIGPHHSDDRERKAERNAAMAAEIEAALR